MKLSTIVVDDQPHAIELLTDYIQKTPFLQLSSTFTNPVDALHFVSQHSVDLIFLDIEMPELTGIEFMNILDGKCKIILTTAYIQYAVQGFDFNAIDYLSKPIAFERFLKAAQKALNTAFPPTPSPHIISSKDKIEDILFVKTEKKGKLQKIALNDIYYIEGESNYVSIYTESDRIPTLLNIKDLEDQLPKGQFFRVHKSYIVSVSKINSIEKSHVVLKKPARDIHIPLGLTYKDNFFSFLQDSIISRKH